MSVSVDTQIEPNFLYAVTDWHDITNTPPPPITFVIPEGYMYVLKEVRASTAWKISSEIIPQFAFTIESSTAGFKRFVNPAFSQNAMNVVDYTNKMTNSDAVKSIYSGQSIRSVKMKMPFDCHAYITLNIFREDYVVQNALNALVHVMLVGNLVPVSLVGRLHD